MEREIAKLKERGFTGQFEFFEAISFQEKPEFHKYENVFLSKVHRGRSLSVGELGCFASHYSLWKKCRELNEAIIVLEDDVEFLDGFFDGTKAIFDSEYEYVRLMGLHDDNLKKLNPPFYAATEVVAGTQGYYITPSAASKFIAKAQYWLLPVDKYMDRFYIHDVLNILFIPFLIGVHSNANETTIQKIRRERLPAGLKFLHKLHRLYMDRKRIRYAKRKGLL